MKTLYIDVETSPNLAYVWRLWDQNVGLSQVVEQTEILCFAYMWEGDTKARTVDIWNDGKRAMASQLHDLLTEADLVVGYNSQSFDMKLINSLLAEEGFGPPAPYKQFDLYREAKKVFKWPSMKLQNVLDRLGLENKLSTGGFELWLGCLEGDWDSIGLMLAYNKQDVEIMPALMERLRPWSRSYPNKSLFVDTENPICPRCGSTHVGPRGQYTSGVGTFQKWYCKDCESWSRSPKSSKGLRRAGLRSV